MLKKSWPRVLRALVSRTLYVYDKTTVVTLDNRQSFVVGLNSTVTLIHVSALLTRNSSLVPNGSSSSKLCLVVARSDDYKGIRSGWWKYYLFDEE
jgi:hypothetical protein